MQVPGRKEVHAGPEVTERTLIILNSQYRYVLTPIVNYVLDLERRHPDREIAIVVPELVEKHWYEYFLHQQHGELLTALLLLEGDNRI